MKKYPHLKDKELGNAIVDFKNYINTTYTDFRSYALSNEDVMKEFDIFYEKR
jgi:hypothetical protein